MAIPLFPLVAGAVAFLFLGRRKSRKKPPAGITIFEGQGEDIPDVIDLVQGERFGVRFWAPDVQEWIFESAQPVGVVRAIALKFDQTPKNNLVPAIFAFEAKRPGEVELDFALQGKGQVAGPSPISFTVRARVT